MGTSLVEAIERAKRAEQAIGMPHYAVRNSHGSYTYTKKLCPEDTHYYNVRGEKIALKK